MRFSRGALFFVFLSALYGQPLQLPASFDKLADKASQSVDVTLDGAMLQLGSRFLSTKDPDEANVKKLISGLKSISVKSFEFDQPGQYPQKDVEVLRSQFKASPWSRVVGVRGKADSANVDVFLKTEKSQITGLVIIAAEPKELTFVHIDGVIDPDQIAALSGHFGIPKLEKDKAPKGGTR